MYILAKRVAETDAWTIHGVSARDEVCAAWQAAGHPVFDLSPEDDASFGYYTPIETSKDEE